MVRTRGQMGWSAGDGHSAGAGVVTSQVATEVDQKAAAITVNHQEQSAATWKMDGRRLIPGSAQSQALRLSPATESDIQ